MKWFVKIPTGRWMAGVNWFRTKALAVAFYDRWNQVEVNSGNTSLSFERDGNGYVGR